METPTYIALSRQTALVRQLDIVANNLANATTPGYKSESSLFAEHLLRAEKSRKLAYVEDPRSFRNFTPGPIQPTGNDLDIAINGDGFLTVQTPDGIRYTRDGRLSLNAQGQLVTSDNFPVLSGGAAITIDPADGQVNISEDGTVSTDRARNGQFLNVVGKIDIVSFNEPQGLRAEGNNLYEAPAGIEAAPDLKPGLVQRALEGSNVKPVVELTSLIAVSRSYQAAQQFINIEHERQRKAISAIVAS